VQQEATRPDRILIVEDDPEIALMAAASLTERGFDVLRAPDGRDIERFITREGVTLIILDVMLPGEDGISICRRLRNRYAIPILMLTALGSEADRIIGLESGADDYLCKPFAPRELQARVRALLRRMRMTSGTAPNDTAPRVSNYRFAGFCLDMPRMTLFAADGAQVPLTGAEFNLLAIFCRHPQQVLSREALLHHLHTQPAAVFDRSIDTLIGRLRRKIEPDVKDPELIRTVRSSGYLFSPKVEIAGESWAG
jgi:two-component system OmpR family response regulator